MHALLLAALLAPPVDAAARRQPQPFSESTLSAAFDPSALLSAARQGARAGAVPPVPLRILATGAPDGAPAAPALVIEDWSAHATGGAGIPAGWTGVHAWSRPAYDFTVANEEGVRALRLSSRADSSTISKRVKINLKETPILEWQWKVSTLPAGADARHKDRDDQALQLYVIWSPLRPRVIGYIWDSNAPEGGIIRSSKTNIVTYIVVRSGGSAAGRWLFESRDVAADYRRIFGEEPPKTDAISIAIDSDDTRSEALAYIGAIRFRGEALKR